MILVAAFVLLAASADPHPRWMVGTWGWQNPGEQGTDCHSDHSITYERDGRYVFMDEVGTWRIEGQRLIETLTDPGGTGDPAMRGKPNVLPFKQIAPGMLAVAGKHPGKMIKCP